MLFSRIKFHTKQIKNQEPSVPDFLSIYPYYNNICIIFLLNVANIFGMCYNKSANCFHSNIYMYLIYQYVIFKGELF